MKRFVSLAGRAVAWTMAFVVSLLSMVPPALRPSTDTPHNFEHFAIFFATGLAFGLGYSRRPFTVALMLVLFAGIVEIAQLFAPARHARLVDFIVDAVAIGAGAILGAAASRTLAQIPPKQTAN
jgi:VanZ family protein